MRSTRLPEPYFAAASDLGTATAAPADDQPHPPLAPLIELFSQRQIFGIVWFDTTLTTTARFGEVAKFVEIGSPIGLAVLPLYGLDDRIVALRSQPGASLEVPNVGIHTNEGSSPKLNFSVYWTPAQATYVMLISRVLSRSDLEHELSNQARARSIAEAKLVEKSREIERANRDLAEFAYVISHDLNAPLRRLRYTVDALVPALGDRPDAEPRRLLEELRQQTARMSAMLIGLLSYSRIGRKREAVEMVDTRALVAEIVGSMPQGHGIAVSIEGNWPAVSTLAEPLDGVLRNLIDNAIKHHDRAAGLVRVICEQVEADHLRLVVADDGPGIAPEFHTAVFQPFVKLGESGGTEPVGDGGSGIGLALVRRTVESVGGRLTISSAAPAMRGTTFNITWPIIEPDTMLDAVVHTERSGP